MSSCRYKAAMVRFRRAEQIVRGLGRSGEPVREMMWVKDAPYLDDYPIALHFLMFMPNLKIMCTDQQAEYWLSLSKTFEVCLPDLIITIAWEPTSM